MNALTWITREAKRLRRRFPKRFKTWREYVGQASAIYAAKHKGRSPVGRKKLSGTRKKRRGKKVGAKRRGLSMAEVNRSIKKTNPAVAKFAMDLRQLKREHAAEGKTLNALGSVQGHLGHAKKILEAQIGVLETRRFKATTARVRNKLSRQIQAKKAQYRKIS